MQEFTNNSSLDLEQSINRRVGLELVEFGLAGVSIVGTLVTLIAKEAIFAAAPLTACVCLNLFTRRQLDHLTQERTFADTTEVQRRLSAELQSLRSQIEGLPAYLERTDYQDVKVSITSLSASVTTLEQKMMDVPSNGLASRSSSQPIEALSAIEAELNQLREHQIDLTQSIETLQGQLPGSAEAVPNSGDFQQEFSALQHTVAQLSKQGPTATADLEPLRAELQSMLEPVQKQVADLSQKAERSGTAPVQEEQLTPVLSQIEDVKVKMDTMLANISEEMEVARSAMENTQQQVNEVQDQLGVIREEATSSTGVSSPDLHQQLQGVMDPLQTQINQLESRINSMPAIDSGLIQDQEEQLQGLQHQLQSLSSRLESASTQFSTEMANMPNMVDKQVQNRIGELQTQTQIITPPQPKQDGKQDQLSELDSLLADLS